MRFVLAEHPPRPGANLISVAARNPTEAVSKIRADLMWLERSGSRFYATIDGTLYTLFFSQVGMDQLEAEYGVRLPADDDDDPAEHDASAS